LRNRYPNWVSEPRQSAVDNSCAHCEPSFNHYFWGSHAGMASQHTLSVEERRRLSAHLINLALLIVVAFGAYTTWFRIEVLDLENGRTTDDIEAWIVSLTVAFILSLRFTWSRYLWRTLLRSLWLIVGFLGRLLWWLVLWVSGRRSEKMPSLRPDSKLARRRHESPQPSLMNRRTQRRH